MELRPDGALRVDGALAMSRLASEAVSPDEAEVARLVQLTLGGDSGAFEQIVMRYETRVMGMATRLLGTLLILATIFATIEETLTRTRSRR